MDTIRAAPEHHVTDIEEKSDMFAPAPIMAAMTNAPEPVVIDGLGVALGQVKSTWDDLSHMESVWLFRWSYFYSFISCTGQINESFVLGLSGSIIANPGFIEAFGQPGPTGVKVLSTSWISAWGSIINVGQIIALIFVPALSERFGRRVAFNTISLWMVIALICLTVAKSPGVWLVGKFCCGLAAGTSQLQGTAYIMEIAPAKIRGIITATTLFWGSIGGLMCSLMLNYTFERYPMNYKLPIWVLYGTTGMMLVCFAILPESPWYWARHDNKPKAFRAFKRLYGNIEGWDNEAEYQIIVRNLEHEAQLKGEAASMRYRDVFAKLNRRRIAVMLAMGCGQQIGGLTLIGAYTVYFFQQAGFANPFKAGLIITGCSLISVLIWVGLIDKVGRRLPICICFTVMTLMLWLIGGLYYAKGQAHNVVLILAATIWNMTFVVFGNAYFLIAAEIATAQLRLKIGSISWGIAALFGVATSWAVPPMLVHINVRAAFVFGVMSLPLCAFFWYYLPETKGRNVAEIDELYERQVPAWKWGQTVTEAERLMRQGVEVYQETRKTGAMGEVSHVEEV